MSSKVIVDLRGLQLVEPKAKLGVKKGLSTLGKMIERDARIFAPRETGLLKTSIYSTLTGFKVEIGSPLFYAEYMERPGNVRREGRRPWLEPALNKNLPLIAKVISDEIRKVMS